MFGNRFYHSITRKYVALFGTLWNDIEITRDTSTGTQTIKVPVSYAPMEKVLSRVSENPNLDAPAITLPRMSFEIVGIEYDGTRKVVSNRKNTVRLVNDNDNVQSVFTPAPYNISFELNILTKYTEDGSKILEQIIPYFKPDWTPSVQLLEDIDYYLDVPVVLNSVTTQDTYEGAYDERRALIWTLNFTLKGYYFGPTTNRKVIKFAQVNTYVNNQENVDANTYHNIVTVQPGLTANGEPTTDVTQTIPYTDINKDDDWDYIVTIKDSEDE